MRNVPASALLLRTRAREAITYLQFLHVAVDINATITVTSPAHHQSVSVSRELTHTLKANLYLLLYSAMEATLVQLIDEIHEAVKTHGISVDALHQELFLHVTREFKRSTTDVAQNTVVAPIGIAVMQLWSKQWQDKSSAKDKRTGLISGNVDGLAIHQHLRRYGVVGGDIDKPHPKLTHRALKKAKDRRNILAHGEFGFADLGRNFSIQELTQDARDVFRTLIQITRRVDKYLNARGYLKTSSWDCVQQ